MVSILKNVLIVWVLLFASTVASATADCFAHTYISLTSTSPPMNDTGATVLIAFSSTYAGYPKIMDVVGGPNKWFNYNINTDHQNNLNYITINIALNPITNTAATFKHWFGSSITSAGTLVFACKGLNLYDLVFSTTTVVGAVPFLAPVSIAAATETLSRPSQPLPKITTRAAPTLTSVSPNHAPPGTTLTLTGTNFDATAVVYIGGSLLTGAGGDLCTNLVVSSTSITCVTPPKVPGAYNVTVVTSGGGASIQNGFSAVSYNCQASNAIAPSAPGDLEFAVVGFGGVYQPASTPTATVDDTRFPAGVTTGGAGAGNQGTVGVTWRVANDTSTYNPTWTLSIAAPYLCSLITFKADTSVPVSGGNPFIETIVGNGYQDWTGDGGPPLAAALNWPSDMFWYKHGVPADKVLVFVDNQNNVIRAVNFDTVAHTIVGTAIAPNTIQTIAGHWAPRNSTGTYPLGLSTCTGEGGPAINATMAHPVGMDEDSHGNLAIADQQCGTIDVVDTNGNFRWVVGGCAQRGTCTGIANGGCGGNPNDPIGGKWYQGNVNNVPLTQTLMNCPQGVAYDNNDNIIAQDSGNGLILLANMQTTAINAYGQSNIPSGYAVPIVGSIYRTCEVGYTPIPGPSARMQVGRQIAVDRATGNFYFGLGNCNQLLKVDTGGNVVVMVGAAGCGAAICPIGYTPSGSPALNSMASNPFRMSVGPNGLIYFADSGANEIRHIDAAGKIQTDVGNHYKWGPKLGYGGGGWYGDNWGAKVALLDIPIGYTFDSTGRLCIGNIISNTIVCTYDAPPVTLTVLTSGGGTVTSTDGNINCGSVCSYGYTPGTTVTLTAHPAVGEQFTGWSGDCISSGVGNCVTGVPVATNAIATFAQRYAHHIRGGIQRAGGTAVIK